MKFSTQTKNPLSTKTDLLVLPLASAKSPLLTSLDKKMGGLIARIVEEEKFEGKAGQTKLFYTNSALPAARILLVGFSDKKAYGLEALRRAGGRITQVAKQTHASHVSIAPFTPLEGTTLNDSIQALAEGLVLATYSFTRYKKENGDSKSPSQAVFHLSTSSSAIEPVLKKVSLTSQAIFLARNLINTPAQDMQPLDLAKAAKGSKGIKTRVLLKNEISRLKMGSYLAVAQGSKSPPAFIEMHYKPKGAAKKKIVLIGKGVTFDSGGLSLKPPKSMETMKDDMSGAAAVIGIMSVISQLAPRAEVYGLVAATENMPDGEAMRPGDVITAMNGKTIEVLNTDAEGRLTLADAVCYANTKKPDLIIDMATLTGACLVALGDRYAGILGNDEDLVRNLIELGVKTGERLWELPLAEEYKEELKSPIADLKNVGGSYGGTINGALFIEAFVGKTPWAHIDIAGPSWTDRPREYETKGGTGSMIRLLAEYLGQF